MTMWREDYLRTADKIGKRLCRDAIWHQGECNWMEEFLEPIDGSYQQLYKALDNSLYNGTPGVILFLQTLYQYNNDPILYETIIGAINHTISQLDDSESVSNIGYYCGKPGVIDTFLKCSETLQQPALKKLALEELDKFCDAKPTEMVLDLLTGSAGVVIFMLRMYEEHKNPAYLECAKKHADFLLEKSVKHENGLSWKMNMLADSQSLTGYSHGVSGIIQAFAELGVVTNDPRYIEAVNLGLNWENQHFNALQQNWPDLRSLESCNHHSECPCGVAWCHGSPGIALSRLTLGQIYPEREDIQRDLAVALHSTCQSVDQPYHPQQNFSLCHGLLGNADVLLTVGIAQGRQDLIDRAYRMGNLGIELFENQNTPWPCGLHDAKELPDLMLGTAGIGYYYLRLYDPQKQESLLHHTAKQTPNRKVAAA